jgi:hypothetical protein
LNKLKLVRKILVCVTTVAIVSMCAFPALADDLTTNSGTGTAAGSVTINGTILPLTISVTHQVTEDYSIDPNTGTITANPITVTNSTRVPVNVTVQSVSSASGGDLTFTDVGPNDENWTALSTADSQKYIALGVKISDTSGWNAGYNTNTDWAADKTAVRFGSLASGATGNLALTAKTGIAFDNTYTAKASIVLVVSLV